MVKRTPEKRIPVKLSLLLISYIKRYVRPQKQSGRYASFYAFVKNFLKCDSISTIRRVAISMIAILRSA